MKRLLSPSALRLGALLCAAWLSDIAGSSGLYLLAFRPPRRWTCCPPRHQR